MADKNRQIFADNLNFYMKQRGVNSTDMMKILNVPSATFSSWRTGHAYPRIDKIQKMADYFGITKADLVEEKKPGGPGLSKARQELLYAVEDMSEEEILRLLDVISAVKGMR